MLTAPTPGRDKAPAERRDEPDMGIWKHEFLLIIIGAVEFIAAGGLIVWLTDFGEKDVDRRHNPVTPGNA